MKILSAPQIRELDRYTIEHEPIASINLMERAAGVFTRWFVRYFPDTLRPVVVFCGPGNNGGDGLAIARMLFQKHYDVQVFRCRIGTSVSEDFQTNLERLPAFGGVPVTELAEGASLPALPEKACLIDGIFGSGLNREVTGYWAELLTHLSGHRGPKIAIDIPSGMFADRPTDGVSFRADHTLSFETPKLAFFFPENQLRVGVWAAPSIGLSAARLQALETPYSLTTESTVRPLLHRRPEFAHKGLFGHALLIAGSRGMMGAAILASRACLRSGAGLLNVHVPGCGYAIMQISVPEAMASIDPHDYCFSQAPQTDRYAALGIGCGLGKGKAQEEALTDLLSKPNLPPLIIDADALNMLALRPDLLSRLPAGTILTPHPGEFDRLFGKHQSHWERIATARKQAADRQLHIVLKGGYTAVVHPDGACAFNDSGNPGMATAGSGDVLTGILTGLRAQGYSAVETTLIGVFLHGLAGDLAAQRLEHEALLAGDLIDHLGPAFHYLKHHANEENGRPYRGRHEC